MWKKGPQEGTSGREGKGGERCLFRRGQMATEGSDLLRSAAAVEAATPCFAPKIKERAVRDGMASASLREMNGMPHTPQAGPGQQDSLPEPEVIRREIADTVRRLVPLCPPQERKALLVSLLESLVAEYGTQSEIAVCGTQGEVVGYFLPAGLHFVTAEPESVTKRLQELLENPGKTRSSKEVIKQLKKSGT